MINVLMLICISKGGREAKFELLFMYVNIIIVRVIKKAIV